jgi:MFS family permease
MTRTFRIGLFVVGAVVLVFAVGFFVQAWWATSLWPVQSGRLSHIFIASILAAIGCPAIWIALADERRALAAGALDLMIVNLGVAATGFYFYGSTGNPGMLLMAIATSALFLLCIVLYRYGQAVPFRDQRPTPVAVRIAFGVFALLLAVVAGMLITVRPDTFPWPLGPENSAIYGFIFLGAMAYFIYGLVYPVWGNACGQLIGFIAYDLVLIIPFVLHFSAVKPELQTNLTVYTAVVALSGLFALYFVFVHPTTRPGAMRTLATSGG